MRLGNWFKSRGDENAQTRDVCSRGVSFTIEPMKFADIPQITAIEELSFDHPWPEQAFEGSIVSPRYIAKAAYLQGAVAAYLITEESPRSSTVVSLAVHPHFRRMDIGKSLISMCIAGFSGTPWRTLLAPVPEKNLDAQLFFKSLGFLCISTPRNWFTDGQTAYVFQYRQGECKPLPTKPNLNATEAFNAELLQSVHTKAAR